MRYAEDRNNKQDQFSGASYTAILKAVQCNYEDILMNSPVNVFLLLKRFHPPIFMLTKMY